MITINVVSTNGQPADRVVIFGKHPDNTFICTTNSHGRIEWPIDIQGNCHLTLMHKGKTIQKLTYIEGCNTIEI